MFISLLKDWGFIASLFVSYKCYDVYKFNKMKIKEIHYTIEAIFFYAFLYQAGTVRWILQDLPEEVGTIDTLIWSAIDVLCFITFFFILVFLKRIMLFLQKLQKTNTYENPKAEDV